jgi:hypothetical protein
MKPFKCGTLFGANGRSGLRETREGRNKALTVYGRHSDAARACYEWISFENRVLGGSGATSELPTGRDGRVMQFKKTPVAWTRELRCELARKLIEEGWRNKAVAAELHFANDSHLCNHSSECMDSLRAISR